LQRGERDRTIDRERMKASIKGGERFNIRERKSAPPRCIATKRRENDG
jgi:hypothetical protein